MALPSRCPARSPNQVAQRFNTFHSSWRHKVMSVHLCRNVILILTLVSAFTLVAAPVAAQQLPAPPAPVAVSLDPATTALLVLDVTTQTCSPQPNCMAMLPRI